VAGRANLAQDAAGAVVSETAARHHAATREDEGRRKDVSNTAATQTPDFEPTSVTHAPPPITAPSHPAHAMCAQALNALQTSPNIPAGTFTQHEQEQLAAGLVARALSQADRFPKPNIDAVVMSTDGTKLIAVYGALDSPANRLAPVDIQQTLSVTSIEQSSEISRAAMQALQLQQQQAQSQADVLGMDVSTPSGPVMRIGARTLSSNPGPGGDSGGGDGGGSGGDGGGGGG
jgi:hypothetical protein